MAEIKVTASQLRQVAQQLNELNQKFNIEIATLEQHEKNLSGMWEGESRKEFHSAFTKDAAKMLTFKQTIDKYAQTLEAMAKEYEDAERKSAQIAATRSY